MKRKYLLLLLLFNSFTFFFAQQTEKISVQILKEYSIHKDFAIILSKLLLNTNKNNVNNSDDLMLEIVFFNHNNRSFIMISYFPGYIQKSLRYEGYSCIDNNLILLRGLRYSSCLLKQKRNKKKFLLKISNYPIVGGSPRWLYENSNNKIDYIGLIDNE